MSSKNTPIAAQGTLFEVTPFGGTLLPIEQTSPVPASDAIDGPHVTLLERIGALKDTLGELGKVSMLGGFEQAANSTEFPQLRRPLETRYDNVDAVVGRAQDAKTAHELRAKQAFARAQGLRQMIDANPQNTEEYKAKVQQDYAEFLALYADAKGAKYREKLRKQLKRQEKHIINAQTSLSK